MKMKVMSLTTGKPYPCTCNGGKIFGHASNCPSAIIACRPVSPEEWIEALRAQRKREAHSQGKLRPIPGNKLNTRPH